jgi:hypothetical protein
MSIGTEHLQAYPVGRKEIEEKVSSISVPLSYSIALERRDSETKDIHQSCHIKRHQGSEFV